jgi:Peptidase A4 family
VRIDEALKSYGQRTETKLVRLWLLTGLVATIASVLAPAALADTTSSLNWAGYAVHRPALTFSTVSGSWRQPRVHCSPGMPTYSAFWLGLGGYRLNAPALEQTGTEIDCNPAGRAVSSAWYELVPGPSVPIRLTVHPADLVRASVTVAGHRVSIRLDDVTRHRGFHKTVYAPAVDVSSAEWIVEAPSECVSASSCRTLPLADFAATTFGSASARATTGHAGPISDPSWRWTRITLTPGGHRFAVYGGRGSPAAAAAPSSLLSRGTSFAVNYALVSAQRGPVLRARSASVRSQTLVAPGR